MSHRVISLIDGYNLYHAVERFKNKRLQWCNLWLLSECFLLSSETLSEVRLYTADPVHRSKNVRTRFSIHIAALESVGVKIIYGHFKPKDRWVGGGKYIINEEKETDVNLAVDMIDLAYQDIFDKCLLISGDSDLRPAVRRTIDRFPNKKVVVVSPPFQRVKYFRDIGRQTPNQLRVMKMKRRHLESSRLPDIVSAREGAIVCPPDYH